MATLLKTAEELRIKGLAEVSWREEDHPMEGGSQNGMQSAALPQVSTVMDSPKSEIYTKRKRGRPPIDDYDSTSSTVPNKFQAKILSVSAKVEENLSNDAISSSDNDLTIWEEDQGTNEDVLDGVRIKTEVKIYISPMHVFE